MRHLAPLAAAALLLACPAMAQEASIAAAQAALAKGDFARVKTLAAPLAEKGDPVARHLLGYLYEKGLGVPADIGEALRLYGDAAIAGNADAQLALGLLAVEGDGVYPDYERAAGWFRLASAQGDPRADVQLGLLYAEGLGVAHDAVAAAHHFAKAAGKGDADGEFFLGLSFLNGDGVPQSYAKAAQKFESAAAKGNGEAAYHLSLLHDSAVLGAPDTDQAAGYMQAAAEAGFVPAYAAMGLIVHRGDSEGIAADWFEKGAAAGDPQAAFLYAVALSKGDGRKKDVAKALSIADRLIVSRATPDPVRAQAESLKKSIAAETNGPLILRD